MRPAVAAVCAALALSACATRTPAADRLADTVTHAVYDDDLDTAVANFDDGVKNQVSRASLGDLSDRMHALGTLQSLTPRSADPDRGRYEYDVKFSNGSLVVQVRVDASGKLDAYRIAPVKAG